MKGNEIILAGILITLGAALYFSSCASISSKANAVSNFDINRYLGTWYEIARFDFRFERDLDNTSAQYSFDKNGSVRVLNSGFNVIKKEWKKAEGKAKFKGAKHIAALKVSFFGPFYADYNVIALDQEYQFALVSGKNLDYLWILSRKKSIPDEVKTNYLKIANASGFDTTKLIWIKHDKNDNPYQNEK